MKHIRIYQGGSGSEYYELPTTRDIKMENEPVYNEVEMISGRLVMDYRGFRRGFTAHWDWFPQDLLYNVLHLIRSGGYFYIRWQGDDTDYTYDTAGYYKIEEGSGMTIFKFVGRYPMWHDITLKFTKQELVYT